MTKEASRPHDSDCALHNAPALPVGECDCSVSNERDLIERLRFEGYPNFRPLYKEGADAFTAMQARLEEKRDRIAALEAENAKLREALEKIAELDSRALVTAIARTALQKDQEE